MSGIVGLLHTDCALVTLPEVRCLVESVALRGPDVQDAWCDGPMALGHTLLRSTRESKRERQPLSLDGQTWIVADGRVDGRGDLIRRLGEDGESELARSPDVELILRAYLRWGEACVERLLGDFAFAIWDRQRQRLFCARDQMGVKPFYYAHIGRRLLFSSTLESLHRHPAVSKTLNDLAIADFLIFGTNQDAASTSFQDIQRLPAAHTLTWAPRAGVSLRRYWTLPIEEPVYYRHDHDYVDQFTDLLREAVSDRLRTERVGIFMSGGLDSPALAATARDLLGVGAAADAVQAFTFVYDELIPDVERHYAGMAAQHLGIPIHYYTLDSPIDCTPPTGLRTPEPVGTPTNPGAELRCYSDTAGHSRVAFHGEGPDNAFLYEWRPHLRYLLRGGRWQQLATDAGKHLVGHKRVPLLPTIPRLIRDRLTAKPFESSLPEWMSADLVDRLQLEARWHDLNAKVASRHPVRPQAYLSFQSPLWQSMFESFEPSYTGVPLEVRHPYVDTRLLRFMLRVPALPWCRAKHLQRCMLKGVLPEPVRVRRKTPLRQSPDHARVRRHGLPPVHGGHLLSRYADLSRIRPSRLETVAGAEASLRLVGLGAWLRDLETHQTRNSEEEHGHGHKERIAAAGRW